MTNESDIHPVECERPRLFVETGFGFDGADGMVVPAGAEIAEDAAQSVEIIRRCPGADRAAGPATIWVADGGLDRAAALADRGRPPGPLWHEFGGDAEREAHLLHLLPRPSRGSSVAREGSREPASLGRKSNRN